MIETGMVNKVDKKFAWVTLTKGDQCAGCNACQAFGDGSFELIALNEMNAKPGDRVEIEINPKQVVKHSAIVFLLPVLSLIVGYFLGNAYLSQIGMSLEAAGIVGSLGLMVVTFAVIIGYDRVVGRAQQTDARINRIL